MQSVWPYDQLMGDRAINEKKIAAIVVLTDGADTDSKTSLADLIRRIKFDNETHTIRVFTIAYGHDANQSMRQCRHWIEVTR